MSVRFLIGRAGSGKSLHCFRAITEQLRGDPLGEPIYLIVPKQETFTAERTLTCASGLPGFCRARIVSFELLGEEILSECGGTAIPQVTELGRQMVIGHLLRKHEKELTYYASAARQVGLAAELDAVFAEIERCGKTVGDLADAAHELESSPDAASLLAKLADLRFLYERYAAYLGQDRLDPQRRLTQVLESLSSCQHIKNARVFVDGFLEFTDYERRMLAGLAKICREMQITLLLDPKSPVLKDVHQLPHELSLFHRTEDAYRRLRFAFNEAGVTSDWQALNETTRFDSPSLKQIEQHLFSSRPVISKSPQNIELIEAPDRRGEVDAAARQIRKLLDKRLRFRDIAVLMRDLNEYQELIDASFREHNIPFFIDRRRTAMHHPLIQFIRSIFQIALHNWPHDAVMTLLKTELAGLKREQVDELENYVLLHRIRGSIWADAQPWKYSRKLMRDEEDDWSPEVQIELDRIDAMRRQLAEKIQPLATLLAGNQSLPLRQIVMEFFALLNRFEIPNTLRQWIENSTQAAHLEQSGEHEQVWSELIALLDQMVDVLGDEQVTAEDFINILETGLERFDLALTPPTVDQVIVGSVDRTRSARPKAAIILGLNDNQFPRVPREGPILSDRERRTLGQHRIELDPDGQQTLLDEQLLGYIAFTRASEFLCLTRAIADEESRPQSPSHFWNLLRGQFPTLNPARIDRESTIDCIGTPRQLVTALMRWVRHGNLAAEDLPWPALYKWFATENPDKHAMKIMRSRAWPALSYTNEAKLSPAIAARLFHSPLHASVSRIETFAACPFKHFARYGLKLAEREDQDVTSLDLGNVCHGILENIVRQMLISKSGWSEASPEMIHSLAGEIGQQLRGELMLSSARNRYLLQRIEKTLGQVIASQQAASKRGRLKPWRAELGFGIKDSELDPLILKTPRGSEVHLHGKIDRVDLIEDQAAYAVIDYKLTGNKLSLDHVYHGLSLQLLTYLLVLEHNGPKLAKKKLTPIAAFYVQLLRNLENVDHPDDAISPDDPLFDLSTKPRGIINWKHRQLIDADHIAQASNVVNLFVKNDGTMGRKSSTDGCESDEFSAMLQLVERKLTQLADRILAGEIKAWPYRIGQDNACLRCEYKSVCRFDVPPNEYHFLPAMKREDVLARAIEECRDGA